MNKGTTSLKRELFKEVFFGKVVCLVSVRKGFEERSILLFEDYTYSIRIKEELLLIYYPCVIGQCK